MTPICPHYIFGICSIWRIKRADTFVDQTKPSKAGKEYLRRIWGRNVDAEISAIVSLLRRLRPSKWSFNRHKTTVAKSHAFSHLIGIINSNLFFENKYPEIIIIVITDKINHIIFSIVFNCPMFNCSLLDKAFFGDSLCCAICLKELLAKFVKFVCLWRNVFVQIKKKIFVRIPQTFPQRNVISDLWRNLAPALQLCAYPWHSFIHWIELHLTSPNT